LTGYKKGVSGYFVNVNDLDNWWTDSTYLILHAIIKWLKMWPHHSVHGENVSKAQPSEPGYWEHTLVETSIYVSMLCSRECIILSITYLGAHMSRNGLLINKYGYQVSGWSQRLN